MKNPDVMTTSDVARRLHVTPSTVFRWIKAGWLRSSPTAGRHNRIREKDLRQFMKERGMWTPDEAGPLRIVVAHSEPGAIEQIGNLLHAIAPDCKIECSRHANGAMLKIGALTPHMVILDADMANMLATHACRSICAASQQGSAKIIVIAENTDEADSLKEAGADRVLKKPFAPEELLTTIRELVPAFLSNELSSAHS